ncbi:hypothetical protein [Gordonia jacobaea]|uniref:hypothetical protein n=1 Tax=Gordonia jacobaea TaxID=122202 RepID=UPI0022E0876D|nr:hypothetical protein [Gordonia jacobaea]
MSETAEKPESHRWGFYAAVMVGCLALSMAGNAVHVWSQWHADVAAHVDRGALSPWVPTIAIMLVPVMVIAMTEMVIISTRRNSGAARVTVAVIAAVVGVIALVVSYSGLVYVFETIIGLPLALALAAPLLIDAPIIAATVGLWDVQQKIRADDATRLDERSIELVTDELDHSVDLLDRPVEMVSYEHSDGRPSALIDPQLDQSYERSYDQELDRSTDAATGLDLQGNRLDQNLDRSYGQFEQPVEMISTDRTSAADERSIDSELGQPGEQVDQELVRSIDRTNTVVERLVEPVDQPNSPGRPDEPDEPLSWVSRAERVREATGITAPAADLARVLEMAEGGVSRQRIADEVGKPKSTIAGWIKRADELGVTEERPRLAVVGRE